jgi:hypothetical protein
LTQKNAPNAEKLLVWNIVYGCLLITIRGYDVFALVGGTESSTLTILGLIQRRGRIPPQPNCRGILR